MSHMVQATALQDLPPARDFVLSAGFAGVAALLAAVIVLCAVLYGIRKAGKRHLVDRDQRDRHHEERRADEQHAAAVARCWDRWWQVLETAAIEPAASEGATLGLGPEVTLEVLRGLLRDAEHLGDDTLTKAIAVYQEQFLLVLAQQSGPLSRLAAVEGPSANGAPGNSPPLGKSAAINDGSAPVESRTEPRQRPVSGSALVASSDPTTAVNGSDATEETTGRRRRR